MDEEGNSNGPMDSVIILPLKRITLSTVKFNSELAYDKTKEEKHGGFGLALVTKFKCL